MTSFPLSFLAQIMQSAPFQPATNYWRAIELTVLIEKAFPLLRSCRTLVDIGCGDGEIMRVLFPYMQKAAQDPSAMVLTGIDIDPAEVALAQEGGIYAKVLCGSADRIDVADASQDAIFSNSVLEHIQPLEAVLAECARILKKDGVFIATIPAPCFHDCLWGSWRPWVSRERYLKGMDEQLAIVRYWSEKDWRDQLGRVGIDVTACIPYLSCAETRRWEFLTRLTGGMLYTLTGGRKRPITIQRAMGMRRKIMLPMTIASLMAWIVCLGVKKTGSNECEGTGFLVLGKKRG